MQPTQIVDLLLSYEARAGSLDPEVQEVCRQLVARVEGWLAARRDRSHRDRAAEIATALDALASDSAVRKLINDVGRGPQPVPTQYQQVSNTGGGSVVMVAGGDMTGPICARAQTAETTEIEEAAPAPRDDELCCPSVDLQIHARMIRLGGEPALQYTLNSPTRVVPFQGQRFRQPLLSSPQQFQADLLEQAEMLDAGKELDGEQLLQAEIPDSLVSLGRAYYRLLFPTDLRKAYRRFRKDVKTLLVISDEPWIPWEWIKPFDDSDPQDPVDDDFLCLQFQLARWLPEAREPSEKIPVRRLLHVRVTDSQEGPELTEAASEPSVLEPLTATDGVDLRSLDQPRYEDLLRRLGAGDVDLVHFAGHGDASPDHPDEAWIELTDRRLRARDIDGPVLRGIKKSRPLTFLNACRAAQPGRTLTGIGGWAEAWVRRAWCTTFVAPQWTIRDRLAGTFAEAFYTALADGETIAAAAQKARKQTRKRQPGNPAWLAYAVYGHPRARLSLGESADVRENEARDTPTVHNGSPLILPEKPWRLGDSPGALLQAEYGVVPFHGREEELEELRQWCQEDRPAAVHLITGAGGMGKTRLAIEICRRMRREEWQAGLVPSSDEPAVDDLWQKLRRRGGPRLLAIDYAETRRELIASLLRRALGEPESRMRVILLARAALDWWIDLKDEGGGVGDLLTSLATSQRHLPPLALSIDQRRDSYRQAIAAFASRLESGPALEDPEDLEASYYQRVLLLHMSALIAIEGESHARSEDGLLDRVLARERRFWHHRARARGLPATLVPEIGRAMAVITLSGGAESEAEAIDRLRSLHLFADQKRDILSGVVRMLRECYPGTPGQRWIEPLMPDLLGEHLTFRDLERRDAEGSEQALFDQLLGPRASGPADNGANGSESSRR